MRTVQGSQNLTPRLLVLLLAFGKAEIIDKKTLALYTKWQRPQDVKRRETKRLSATRR